MLLFVVCSVSVSKKLKKSVNSSGILNTPLPKIRISSKTLFCCVRFILGVSLPSGGLLWSFYGCCLFLRFLHLFFLYFILSLVFCYLSLSGLTVLAFGSLLCPCLCPADALLAGAGRIVNLQNVAIGIVRIFIIAGNQKSDLVMYI